MMIKLIKSGIFSGTASNNNNNENDGMWGW